MLKVKPCNNDFVLILRLNVPVNNFSVMSGWSQHFLGLTSTVESYCVLLKDTTQCCQWGSNPGPLNLESDAPCYNVVIYYRHIKIINLGAMIWPCYSKNCIIVRHVIMRLKCMAKL